jgi:hypothetical protein
MMPAPAQHPHHQQLQAQEQLCSSSPAAQPSAGMGSSSAAPAPLSSTATALPAAPRSPPHPPPAAGFYLNASQDKWKAWRMYDYVTKELPALLAAHFPSLDTATASIMGHSMGGHGALTIALTSAPGSFKSVSAFAPICNPINVPWGQKAFSGYLGEWPVGCRCRVVG